MIFIFISLFLPVLPALLCLSIVNNETDLLYVCEAITLIEQKSGLTTDISIFVLDKYLLHV